MFRLLFARPSRSILRPFALAVFLLAWPLFTGCSGEPREVQQMREAAAGKNLVMILLDAGAYGHFGYAGYERDTTPVIDALARESVVFRTAYSPAASTAHTVYTMLTSTYAFLAEAQGLKGIRDQPFRVTETTELMPELLAPRFERRMAVTGNAWFGPEFGLDRGFDAFYETYDREAVADTTLRHAERTLAFFEQDLAQWGDEPSFAYLHFLEPHTPYTPPDEFARMFHPTAIDSIDARSRPLLRWRLEAPDLRTQEMIRALYDANLRFVDHQVGKVIELLKASGRWEDTIVVVMADHGEAFWQHGVYGHGRHVYEEFVHIPLLVRIPGLPALAGREIRAPVSLVDLLPTYLDLYGLPIPEQVRGLSFLPLIAGRDDDFTWRPIFLRNTHGDAPEFGLRIGRYKWVYRVYEGRYLLFDLEADPGETHDLVAAGAVPAEVAPFKEQIALWIATGTGQVEAVEEMDPATREKLRAIGYF